VTLGRREAFAHIIGFAQALGTLGLGMAADDMPEREAWRTVLGRCSMERHRERNGQNSLAR
jgi:hypothetical protein